MELEQYRERVMPPMPMSLAGGMQSGRQQTSTPGEVLIKVQEDLKQLKERLLLTANIQGSGSGSFGGGHGGLDISTLENAISNTEMAIMRHGEELVGYRNQQLTTLPTLDPNLHMPQFDQPFPDKLYRDKLTQEALGHRNTPMDKSRALTSYEEGPKMVKLLTKRPMAPKSGVHDLMGAKQVSFESPGIKMQHDQEAIKILDPTHPENRETLHAMYGISLPLIVQEKDYVHAGMDRIHKGSNIEPATVLPRVNRIYPQLNPPGISEDDLNRGLLSLIERGLIPPAAEITIEPSPIRQSRAPLHRIGELRNRKHTPEETKKADSTLTGVKLDPNIKTESDLCSEKGERVTSKPINPKRPAKLLRPSQQKVSSLQLEPPSGEPTTRTPKGNLANDGSGRKKESMVLNPTVIEASEGNTPTTTGPTERRLEGEMALVPRVPNSHPYPPPVTPHSAEHLRSLDHRFAIQLGKSKTSSPEYGAFKQHYCLNWGSIIRTLGDLEALLSKFKITVALVNGDKLADLAMKYELETSPSRDELLSVVVNLDTVMNEMNTPGQRFKTSQGKHQAATLIQSMWRMHVKRSAYLHYRKQKWAAGMIAISWIMNAKLSKIRKQLVNTNRSLIDSYRLRMKLLSSTWDEMKANQRIIIHIPSLGHSARVRYTLEDMALEQSRQMGRLCDLADPNVKIIYISPVPVSEEFQQYFSKLLGLKPAVLSGDVEHQTQMDERFTIIVPDALESFPNHSMCLTSLIKYSPLTVKRIQNLVAGNSAYIVPGVIHRDELHLSDLLDVPVLGPEPDVANSYATKSGLKRIFVAAKVDQPPCEFDIHSLDQLTESLAQLVTEHLDNKLWLLKIDDEFNGRGIAVCPVNEHLKCFQWAKKQQMRYGDKWNKKWAHEPAFQKILEEIPEILATHTKPANTDAYPTWEKFLDAFLEKGGVIEAYPSSENTTAIRVDVLIEPTGTIQIVSQGDQIHAETQFSCWGTTVPQCSIESKQLNEATMKIAETCKNYAIIGYVTIDFVTFIDPVNDMQQLWAIDLNLGFSDQLSLTNLTKYVSNAVFDPDNSLLTVSAPPNRVASKHRRRRREEKEFSPNRYAVLSTRLFHSNMSVIHYSVFFQMCRAQGIGYDLKERQGCVFTLLDSYSRQSVGMLCLHEQLPSALATFARNLHVLHHELSSPAMQGHTNFHAVIKDIEEILGVAVVNEELQKQIVDKDEKTANKAVSIQEK
ncbi:IQ domain-containing protein H-like isoform X2 [Symsagittifera roscoffensis]|uniref:IQ domain-containing protein H-like isoform X2 n=1 Tax=Symsagittifera roscoffensis TaxID=84072 RepID=UPI00307CB8EE